MIIVACFGLLVLGLYKENKSQILNMFLVNNIDFVVTGKVGIDP